ncbi:MAG: C45 family autoproteolytic acyltransferase/hydrolase [bacterium]
MNIVRTEGAPRDVGFAHGKLIAGMTGKLEEIAGRILEEPPGVSRDEALAVSRRLGRCLEESAPEIIEEFNGLVEGAKWDRDEALLYQMLPYVIRLRVDSCTALFARGDITRDGEPILLKNKDYWTIFEPYQVVNICRCDDGYHYISFGILGWVGCDQGINEAGLTSILTWCGTPNRGWGIQSHILNKLLLKRARNSEEAISLLRGIERTGMCNYLMTDPSGKAVVFENAHSACAVRSVKDGFLVCTNHFETPEMKPHTPHIGAECPPERLANTYSRFDRAMALMAENAGSIDLNLMKEISRDHFPYPSFYSICNHGEDVGGSATIATFIALPTKGRVLIREGKPCAGKRFREFDFHNR